MLDRSPVAAAIVRRGLARDQASPRLLADDRLIDVVPGYPSAESKRHIAHEVGIELAETWPGLRINLTLRDDSTVRDVVEEIALHLGAWFGE